VELDENLQIRPALALAWSNPDETTWRFRLRPGVVFHDGTPFGAPDVKRTLERARGLKEAKTGSEIRALTAIRVVDELTVELKTDRPRPLLLTSLAMTPILTRSVSDAEITAPVGTGPFAFVPGAGGKEVVRGRRFERYWGRRPDFPGFTIEAHPDDEERAAAALAGADVTTPLPPQALDSAGRPKGAFRVLRHPTATVSFLVCRVAPGPEGPSPFRDVRVRRAISLAVDRPGLVRLGLNGEGLPAWQLVTREVAGFHPDLPSPASDVAAARALLRSAGLPRGFRSSLLASARGAVIGAEIVRQLSAAGIALTLEPLTWPEIYARMASGSAPLVLASWTATTGDSSSMLEMVLHTAGARGMGGENTTGFSDPALDLAIERASEEMRASLRSGHMAEIMKRALEEGPLIPLYSPTWTYGVRSGLRFSPRLDMAVPAAAVSLDPGA
jgi:peptide/nickel transport system substrate-binding protein